MAVSRLRLRIASGFAVAFAVSLALIAAGALGYLWRESNRRFDAHLDTVVRAVARSVQYEVRETPDSSLTYAAHEAVEEWPRRDELFIITDSIGRTIASSAPDSIATAALSAWNGAKSRRFSYHAGDDDMRASWISTSILAASGQANTINVVAFGSTAGIESDTQLLGVALAIAAPLILLLSLAGGYVLARRSLRPVVALGESIAAIAPTDLSRRLPVAEPQDEIGTLAVEFNSLLARLDDAQARNRGFIREAAHQIRTPLTLVLGEAAFELAASESTEARLRAALARVRTAAEQMRRRVDELFLLAEAQSGEAVRLDSDVELDSLVLEGTDLMRARAQTLGRTLAIGRAEHVIVRANAPLLQEAVVELIENACRHGTADAPVVVSSIASNGHAMIEVSSSGEPFALSPQSETRGPEGLGLPIVQWVAGAHNGSVTVAREGDLNVVRFALRVKASS